MVLRLSRHMWEPKWWDKPHSTQASFGGLISLTLKVSEFFELPWWMAESLSLQEVTKKFRDLIQIKKFWHFGKRDMKIDLQNEGPIPDSKWFMVHSFLGCIPNWVFFWPQAGFDLDSRYSKKIPQLFFQKVKFGHKSGVGRGRATWPKKSVRHSVSFGSIF